MNEEIKTEDQLKNLMLKESEAIAEKYDELFKKLEEGNYFKQTYAKDSTVVIPGQLFSSFVNFVNSQMQTMYTMQSTMQILLNTGDAIITNLSKMTISLMEAHMANVDSGSTISGEEMDKLDAKQNIKEIVDTKPKKEKKTKAKGTEV